MAVATFGIVVWSCLLGLVGYWVFICARFLSRYHKRSQMLKDIPCDPKHWLLGNLNQYPGPTEVGLKWMKEKSAQSPEGLGLFWFGPFYPAIHVFHPETVKTILKTSEPKPLQFGGYYNISRWLGDGLLLSGGRKWERNRRLLTPAFHFDILRPYMEVNNRCTDILIDKLNKFAERNEFFEVMSPISQLTLDIILRCAFSYDNDCQLKGESHPYVSAVNSLGVTVTRRLLTPYLYPDFIFNLTPTGRQFAKDCKFVHDLANEVIRNRKVALLREKLNSKPNKRYLDFLDILLTARDADGKGLTDQEIRDEVDTFLFEGHDTTSSGISWTLYSLASHPEHLKLCQQEVDEILKDKSNQDIEWDDLPKLKYLSLCIKESLRCHTTVPFIQRETTKDITIGGRFLPAGMMVNIELYLLHHNKETWADPDEFRPERFLPENLDKMDPFAFCPFSAGPRNCIGQHFALHEMKSVVAKIISRFDLWLDPDRPAKHRIILVMKTEDGMFLRVTPRNSAA